MCQREIGRLRSLFSVAGSSGHEEGDPEQHSSVLQKCGVPLNIVKMLREFRTDAWVSEEGLPNITHVRHGTLAGNPFGDITFGFLFTKVGQKVRSHQVVDGIRSRSVSVAPWVLLTEDAMLLTSMAMQFSSPIPTPKWLKTGLQGLLCLTEGVVPDTGWLSTLAPVKRM